MHNDLKVVGMVLMKAPLKSWVLIPLPRHIVVASPPNGYTFSRKPRQPSTVKLSQFSSAA